MVFVQYRLPDVLSAICGQHVYGPVVNPHFAELDAYFTNWINAQKLSSTTQKSWIAVQMPLLASLTNPYMTLAQLQVCLEYMVLSLGMEDLTDTASSVESERWAQFFMDLLRNPGNADERLLKVHPMITNVDFISFSVRVMKDLGDPYTLPFIQSNDELVRGMVQESLDREAEATDADQSSVEAYIRARRTTIGIQPVLVLGRWARGLDLPDEVLCSAQVTGMVDATIDMVFLANDIYSYKKERIACAVQHNIVTVAMNDQSTRVGNSNVQGAVDYAYELIHAAHDRFQRLLAELSSTPMWDTYQDALKKYAENMHDWAVGNVVWSLASPRYSVFDNPSTKSTMMVEFYAPL
ncbi:terpene cyclase [Pleurotus pulmonarius]|nr:terpene cyclase [Pleurotus pulmonarius]